MHPEAPVVAHNLNIWRMAAMGQLGFDDISASGRVDIATLQSPRNPRSLPYKEEDGGNGCHRSKLRVFNPDQDETTTKPWRDDAVLRSTEYAHLWNTYTKLVASHVSLRRRHETLLEHCKRVEAQARTTERQMDVILENFIEKKEATKGTDESSWESSDRCGKIS